MENITRQYYDKTESAVKRMSKFIKEMDADDKVVTKGRQKYPGLFHEGSTRFLYIYDLIFCYKRLGYEPDLSRKETLALLLSLYNRHLGHRGPTYDGLEEMTSEISADFETFASLASRQVDQIPDSHGFLFSDVLSETGGHDAEDLRYKVLLYRIVSIVAKADDTVSPEESRWLAEMLRMTEGKTGRSMEEKKAFVKLNTVSSMEKPQEQERPARSDAMKELDSLVGLESVKEQVRTLANFAVVQKRRGEMGLRTTPVSMHLVFSGNPGTGKTTVARIMGSIYKDLGLLKSGHLVEADRATLVAGFTGQTAPKTNRIIDSAIGGVLFIDEAYSLVSDSQSDFGPEAIATLIKRMEDDRDELAVILAGYTDRMETFMASNPGLGSRFSRRIEFEDYSAEELFRIYSQCVDRYDYVMTEEAESKVRSVMERAVEQKGPDFGNGRFARNIFERTIESQANRVAFLPTSDQVTLSTIELQDVENL